MAQAHDWLLGSAARVLGVHGDWDAVIVDGQVMTRADWGGPRSRAQTYRETAPAAAAMAEFFGSLLGGGRARHDELPDDRREAAASGCGNSGRHLTR